MKSSRRHDLKHDQLADTLGAVWEYIVLHRAKVIAIAAAVLLIAGMVSWIYAVDAMAHREADNLLAEAQDVIWRIEELRRNDPDQALMLSGRAIADLREIAQEFPATPAAAQALLKAGRLLFDEGQHERAAQVFREVVADTARRPVLRQLARRNLAAALEQAGEFHQALAEYRRLAEEAASALARAQCYWDIGRCYEELGDIARAKESYAAAAQAAPDSLWAEHALSRRSALAAVRKPTPDPPAADAPEPAEEAVPEPEPEGGSQAEPAPEPDEPLTTDAPDAMKAEPEGGEEQGR